MRLDVRDLDLLVTVYKHINAEGARPDLAAALLLMIERLSRQNTGEYTTYLSLSREQVERSIPYKVICEARYGARWDTGTRKRRWASEFSHTEQQLASRLFRQAHTWVLTGRVPASVKMPGNVYDLWQKLGDFCAML